MTDVVLIAVIVAFFLAAAWLVTLLGRVTAGYRDETDLAEGDEAE